MKPMDKKLIHTVLVRNYYLPKTALRIDTIPGFNQKAHYNIISLITHVLILMGFHPIKITDMKNRVPLHGYAKMVASNLKNKTKQQRVETIITDIISPLQKRRVTTKETFKTYRYSLLDIKSNKKVSLFFRNSFEDCETTPRQKMKIAHVLAQLLGIRRVMCVDSNSDMIVHLKPNYLPYRYVLRKYPDEINRKLIYCNLIRLLEGVDILHNPTLSDHIQ